MLGPTQQQPSPPLIPLPIQPTSGSSTCPLSPSPKHMSPSWQGDQTLLYPLGNIQRNPTFSSWRCMHVAPPRVVEELRGHQKELPPPGQTSAEKRPGQSGSLRKMGGHPYSWQGGGNGFNGQKRLHQQGSPTISRPKHLQTYQQIPHQQT